MIIFYTAIFYLLLPFIFLRLLWRSRKNSDYRKRWLERLAIIPSHPERPSIWVHAVSVGEVIAAMPLVRLLAATYPGYNIVMTTTTPTGSVQVMRSLSHLVTHYYLPYDLPWCINRFITRCRVKYLIIIETELWPNLLRCNHKKGVPILVANARLSLQSKRRYDYIRGVMKSLLADIDIAVAQNEADAARYIDLGLDPSKVETSGNIKFDLTVPQNIFSQGAKMRERTGFSLRPTIVLASTHEGEEKIWVSILKRIKLQIPDVLLLVVPRHQERFDLVCRLFTNHHFIVARRSLGQIVGRQTDIYLGDTMGELLQFYAAGDISFVGGSLVPIGGHNLIEPSALGLPVITGPYLQNFEMVKQQLLDAKALRVLEKPDEIAQGIVSLLKSREERLAMGRRAKEVVATNNGALQRHMDIIDRMINPNHFVDSKVEAIAERL